MADEQNGEGEQTPVVSTEPYESNEDAFEDAWVVAEVFGKRFFLEHAPPGNELREFIRVYHLRLRRSSDHILLARMVRVHRLTPERLVMVLLVLQNSYLPRAHTIGELLVTAVGFDPPRIDRLWRWVRQSPHLIGICGSRFRPGPSLFRAVIGGAPISESDFLGFVRQVSALGVADRGDIPDNQVRQGGAP